MELGALGRTGLCCWPHRTTMEPALGEGAWGGSPWSAGPGGESLWLSFRAKSFQIVCRSYF